MHKIKEANILKRHVIDSIDGDAGHTVLMLPPYRCVLNHILPTKLPTMRPASKTVLLHKIKQANIQKRHVFGTTDGETGHTVLMLLPNHLC